MSFQPPPSPGQTPPPPNWGGPPAAGGPPAGAPPAFGGQPGGPSGVAPGGRAKKAKMVAPGMIIAGLVLIAVAVGVVVLTRDSDGGGLDAEAAAEGFAALIDDTDLSSGIAELRRCPLGDVDDLNEQVADTLDLPDEVLDGDVESFASDDPESLWCAADADATDPDAAWVWYGATAVPRGSWERYLESALGDDELEIEDPQSHQGGSIYAYCYESAEGDAGCGADWVHEDARIAIGLVSSGDDPDAAVDALKDVLPDLVEALADQA